MILLSRLIKSQFAKKIDNDKQPIAVQTIQAFLNDKLKTSEDQGLSAQASFIIQSAKEEADQMIQTAQAERAGIIQQIAEEQRAWEHEKDQLYEQIRQEAYAEGLEIGRQEALRQYQGLIEDSQRVVDLAKNDYDEKIQKAEETILGLSIEIARKVISSILIESPEKFLPVVRQGLKEVKEFDHIKIHVHPSQYELLISQKDELNALVTNDTDISIYANADLKIDDCYIESDYGRIDISIDTQLQQLKNQLLQLLDEG